MGKTWTEYRKDWEAFKCGYRDDNLYVFKHGLKTALDFVEGVFLPTLNSNTAVEREAHKVTTVALDTTTKERNHALATSLEYASRLESEREGADALAKEYLIDMEFIHDNKLGHEGLFAECENGVCTHAAKVLAAHDARRAGGGG